VVTRRTPEVGIRVALGAGRSQVLRSITGGAAVYLAGGGVIGSTRPHIAEGLRRCFGDSGLQSLFELEFRRLYSERRRLPVRLDTELRAKGAA
jgi:hypothetical protein